MNPREIKIADYTYNLPNERIAWKPIEPRDAAKLLVHRNGEMVDDVFSNLVKHLPAGATVVFNNTKVINARLLFTKQGGTSTIEVFCLEPAGQIGDYATVLAQTGNTVWKCFVGGRSKWKTEFLEMQLSINGQTVLLKAKKIGTVGDAHLIKFSWEPAKLTFIEIITAAGAVPLPPYIKRKADAGDAERYQAVFAKVQGSVAAPTASLHFTAETTMQLREKCKLGFVTLHVGAGTFMPVKSETIADHIMHEEYIDVTIETIKHLKDSNQIVAVGTTALRTIESLYWLGAKAFVAPENNAIISIGQWDAYDEKLAALKLSRKAALQALADWMRQQQVQNLFTKTQLLIAPGYQFKMADWLSTNFHQPNSTLLLLVAAAVGDDWRKIYGHALQNDYRFLSYGDTSLLRIGESKKSPTK